MEIVILSRAPPQIRNSLELHVPFLRKCLCCVKAVSSLSSCNLHAHLLLSSPGVGGGVTSLQEANGDVPQDGVAFSRLVYYHEVGGILNRVIRMGSHIF